MECVGDLPEEMTLQRYVDFVKFVSLLDSRKIFLPRASKFEDQLEGSLTPIDTILSNGIAELLDIAISSLPNIEKPTADELNKKQTDNCLKKEKFECRKFNTVFGPVPANEISYEKLVRQQREWVDVSCWHANEKESMAMWKIYGGTTNAVCIVTDVTSLKSSVYTSEKGQKLILAKVEYISHLDEQFKISHSLAPLMHKAHFYSFEQEVRLMSFNENAPVKKDRPSSEYGSYLEVNLEQLIKEIRVSSKSPKWFHDLVKNVLKKYGLNIPVCESGMNQKPFF